VTDAGGCVLIGWLFDQKYYADATHAPERESKADDSTLPANHV
jgi:hypothetical protein